MSDHGRKQQKKLAQRKARREKKRAQLARQTSPNPMIRLDGCEGWPIVHSSISTAVWGHGLGEGVLSRRMPNGNIAFAMFLVDTYCLGVKNAFWAVKTEVEHETVLRKLAVKDPWRTITPEYLVKIIRGAVSYAANLGFPAHPDYRSASLLLEGIDPNLSSEPVEFGKDGKPFYVQGPHESSSKAKAIALRMEQLGAHFVLPMQTLAGSDWDDDFEDEEDELEDLPPGYLNDKK